MVITGVFFQGHANIRPIGYPARGGAWQGQDNIRPTGYPLEGGHMTIGKPGTAIARSPAG